MKNSNQQKTSVIQRNRKTVPTLSQKPPAFKASVASRHKFRFVALNGVTNESVTRADLLNLMVVATGGTSACRLLAGVRLLSISIWSPILATFDPQTVCVEWLGAYAPSSLISDTSVGMSPARLRTHPPVRSSAEWWTLLGQNESETLLNLTAPTGSIVDVSLDLVFIDNESATSGTAPYTGLTTGQVYYGRLDGYNFQATGGVSAL
jgi:hypothetical protein